MRKSSVLVVSVCLCACMSKVQTAEELYAKGMEARVKEDYAQARKLHIQAAEKGNTYAMVSLGDMYCGYGGSVFGQDYAKACEWYSKAAEMGNTHAMVGLGRVYVEEGVMQDYAKACEWFSKAADMGNPDAMHWLGYMYENGFGVPRDSATARKWHWKASDIEFETYENMQK